MRQCSSGFLKALFIVFISEFQEKLFAHFWRLIIGWLYAAKRQSQSGFGNFLFPSKL